MTTILIVGAADTGRAPMAAVLLRRLLNTHNYPWLVASAGVLGHDGAMAEIEARDTMLHMGLDISDHAARSISDELVEQAGLLIAIDRGTALVVRARFTDAADRTYSLGELAGRQRDIPDPFRMQIGAWMTYAREIEAMLTTALPRIAALLTAAPTIPVTSEAPMLHLQSEYNPGAERSTAAGRIAQLLQLASHMPDVVDWSAARARIEADLTVIATSTPVSGDLIVAYTALLRAALALIPGPQPSAGQLAVLQRACEQLATPIRQTDVNDLSLQIAQLPSLL